MADCYAVIGIIHTAWPFVPGRFKDYISTPKQNDYSSLHTTVVGPKHQRVELQIRTRQMDEVAEFGIAAHALYKDQPDTPAEGEGKPHHPQPQPQNPTQRAAASESKAYAWLRHTIELLAEGDNPEEFLENTKLELLFDQVYCFTPKGLLIALPRGANAIDFAYSVHTNIGNRAVAAASMAATPR